MTKVLVVDDSLSVRKVVERALAGRQIDVVCAASGSEALEQLERDAPDLVVCDVVIPDRDGYEICEFIKGHPRLAHTPVLLMSGIVNDEVRERAARAQSVGILAKPFAADDLIRHLDGLLAQRPAASAKAPAARGTPATVDTDTPVPLDTTPVPNGATADVATYLTLAVVERAVFADREGVEAQETAAARVDAHVVE